MAPGPPQFENWGWEGIKEEDLRIERRMEEGRINEWEGQETVGTSRTAAGREDMQGRKIINRGVERKMYNFQLTRHVCAYCLETEQKKLR